MTVSEVIENDTAFTFDVFNDAVTISKFPPYTYFQPRIVTMALEKVPP
jgi:hypothetical protein